jgi:hypothetical protein
MSRTMDDMTAERELVAHLHDYNSPWASVNLGHVLRFRELSGETGFGHAH